MWTSVSRGGVILPDGCVDLVWRGDGLIVAGPATGAIESPVPLGTTVFGVRFRLGVAGAALGVPAVEFADLSVDAEAVLGPRARPSAWPRAGCPRCSALVRARLRPVDPLDRAAALAMARPETRVAELGAALGVSERQLRRRFLDAVGYGPKTLARVLRFQRFLAAVRRERRPRAARLRRGLRRPGAPHARGAAALRAHAGRARRVRRRAGGRTCPFRSSRRRAGRVPSGGMIDKSRGVHLEDRARAGAAAVRSAVQGRRPRGGEGRAGALQDRGRRVRLRAGARRARPDEPAAAHLDRAGGAGGRRLDRPARAGPPGDDHRARRRRARGHPEHERLAASRRGGRSATEGSLLATALLFAPLSKHVAHPWLGRAETFLWNAVDAIDKTHPYEVEAAITFLDAASDRPRAEAAAERLGGLVREQDLVGTAARGLLARARSTTRTTSPRTPTASPARGSATRSSTPRSTCSSRARPTHGGWDITWAVWTPAIEIEWSGLMTIAALEDAAIATDARSQLAEPTLRVRGRPRGRRSSRGSRRCRRGPRGCRSASSAWSHPPRPAGRASSGGT